MHLMGGVLTSKIKVEAVRFHIQNDEEGLLEQQDVIMFPKMTDAFRGTKPA